MTLFDILIARWAPAWGAGTFLPIAFAFSAVFSLAFLPLVGVPRMIPKVAAIPLGVGALLMAIQAIGMTVTLGVFGDATKVNIVYSLRGLWGVLIPWLLWAQPEQSAGPRVMRMRLVGAVLISISVVLVVFQS